MDPMEKLAALAAELEKKIVTLSEKKAEDEKQAAELKAELDKLGKEQAKLAQKMLDLQQSGVGKAGGEKQMTLGERMVASDGYKGFLAGTVRKVSLAAASPVVTPDGAVPADFQGVKAEPTLAASVKAAFPHVTTTSNSISWLQEKEFTNNAAAQTEGSVKGESKAEFEEKDAPVRTIAHFIRITKQLAEDAPALAAYINTRMTYLLDREIEDQLLNGTGTSPNLSGIFASGNYVAHGVSYDNVPEDFTVLDLIRRCATKINAAGYRANTLFINPMDFDTLRGMKDANGQYLMGTPMQDNASVRPWGLAVCESSNVAEGKFMVADTRMGATIYDRQGITLEMFEQDSDNVQKNLVTIRAECRMAFAIESVNCFVGGDLEVAAKTGGVGG